jgi:hypothetical protein
VMLRVHSRFRRALATGLMVLLGVVSVLPLVTHAELFDDPYCEPYPAGAAHGAHQSGTSVLRTGTDGEDAQHCDVCHWLRSIRVFDPEPAVFLRSAAIAIASGADTCDPPDTAALVSCGARAPPA